MEDSSLFATARDVSNIGDCYFYHVMDLPGHGTVGEEWDLRGREVAYLGGVSFQGKRVLELGTASGFFCRFMESQGADVVGLDLAPDHVWDLVPFAGLDMTGYAVKLKDHIERLKNGWWFAHRLFHSRAKAVYANIYALPQAIGLVDIATFGAILLHLRDPFDALCNALSLTRETVIVTEVHPEQPADSRLGSLVTSASGRGLASGLRRLLGMEERSASPGLPRQNALYFLPNPQAQDPSVAVTWWCFTPEVICAFLGVLGFGQTTVTEHMQVFQGRPARMFTVVGKRTHALPGERTEPPI